MKRMPKTKVGLMLLGMGWLASMPAAVADTLRDRMTAEQFEQAGLDKISPEELRYLTRWIDGEVVEERERVREETIAEIIPEGDARFGADEEIKRNVERVRPEPKELTATISGEFRGWRGEGYTFELDNGQVWETTERGRFVVRLTDPVITIEKGILGAYFLSVEGYGSRVKVKRVK